MSLSYLPNVTALQFDRDMCTGCGMCVEVCPHAVFVITDDLARITDRDACMECGACAVNCETGAITVRSGVGCAAAVLNEARGRTDVCCCSDPGD